MIKNIFLRTILMYTVVRRATFRRRVCVFYPTCSEYATSAILRYGAARGAWFAVRRVLRCHPWQKCGYDPVK